MYINPSFRPYEPHLCHFSFRECERSLGARGYLVFVRKKDLASSLQVFHSNQVFQVRKLFQVWKLNISLTSTFFLNSKHTFSRHRNFSFIELPWDRLTDSGLHFTFSSKTHERDIIFDWNMFLHDPTWKFQLMYSCSKFEYFSRNFTFAHEIGCLACMTSLSALASAQLGFAWKMVVMYKTYQN